MQTRLNETQARAAETPGVVRHILARSMLLAVAAMAAVYLGVTG
jgi:hypothetical protein